jgi:hypothetical protein
VKRLIRILFVREGEAEPVSPLHSDAFVEQQL